ncbi:DNA alkylation repair protein [Sphingobium lignivorans]|uniref:3-methyladenine DNA glycosylase AlkD n=1 Tax=Sphingobium lignivorans TaxID=2735886 RepID=A0ABR6NJW1_9SPHN|nr:DNA alkylation repair protein [Sphingobium lignivorans]MBB5987571.1 3-methyladenine DNA glycosylase AlkD [Sphingobium lignivorans]
MTTLAETVRAELGAVAEPARAPAMQAYMKSAMPYLGVSAVPLRAACKRLFADLAYGSREEWQSDVLTLWRGAAFREERYAAIALSGIRAARAFQRLDALPMYEEMIVTGAWWDYVDTIAAQRLFDILGADPEGMASAMRVWAQDADLWKRRSAILCQLRAGKHTDLDLFYACIAPSLDSQEFFLRKAIGWALRQYARTDPAEVRRYVAANKKRLSPLSRREALKRIGGEQGAG